MDLRVRKCPTLILKERLEIWPTRGFLLRETDISPWKLIKSVLWISLM